MHDDIGVLALVSDDWAIAPQRRHQILTRIAASVPVAWVSPALHWSERLNRRSARASIEPLTADRSRMLVIDSATGLPAVRRPPALRDSLARRRVLHAARWLRRYGCARIELQVWNPDFANAIDWLPGAATSYHIDDEYSGATVDVPLSETERRLIERVDRVYVSSPKLLETKGGINPHTIFSSNGVDWQTFSAPMLEPADLAGIPHPRAAYVGVLKEQLDLELLTALATSHAPWSFVFVGPERHVHTSLQNPLARLAALPNVHLLGERNARALPAYLQHVDVALLPYRRNDYTDAMNPMKLYEALATGTPVVGSRIRTLQDFSAVVTLADSLSDWSEAITQALSPAEQSRVRRGQRQDVARAHDWDTIAAAITQAIGRRD